MVKKRGFSIENQNTALTLEAYILFNARTSATVSINVVLA